MMRVGRVTGRAAALVLAAVLASCADGTSPNLQGAEVRILLNSNRYDEQTIAVGSNLVLGANVYDVTGKVVPGQSFQWSSEDEAVATVSAGGVVTGNAVGTTRIIARHDVGEASAIVNVAMPLTGPPTCDPEESQTFQVGVPRTFAGNDASAICLPANGEYSVVIVNSGSTAPARLQTRVTATGLRTSFGPPTPLLAPQATLPGQLRPTASEAFHERMRRDVSARLEPRLGGPSAALMPTRPALQASEGQLLNFNVETRSEDGCSAQDIDRRGARVRLVSERAILVEDTLNPADGYTDADFREFGALFDNEIWPLVTSTFGEPTDIDGNGRVYIFFTMAVNQRRENSGIGNQGSFVGGFFYNRDLFPTSGRSACAGSNAAEMFYLLVPDPTGSVRGSDADGEYSARAFSVDFVKRHAPAVIVHEFQHLVNDSRRLHITNSMVWEESWLNEGLSHIAEELMFFDQSGLNPRENLDASSFQNNPLARSEFSRFQLANLDRLASMLRQPSHTSLIGADLLETRGAAWYFLRYAADRRGGDEQAFWRSLVNATTSGLTNLERVLGTDPRPWIADWSAAIYLDDSGVAVPPEYEIRSWNFRSIYPAAGNLWPGNFFTQFPLQVYGLVNSGSQTSCRLGSSSQSCEFSLQGGSAAYLRTGTGSAGTGGFRVTVGGLPAPSRLRVIVTRLS